MSYNGSGVFNINTAGQPVITGTTISSTTFNSLTADLATGLTTALTKDGQSTPTANIGMGAFKITNLAAGTVASDAARLDQVQGGAATFITVTGTDTLTGTVVPALSAYATGNQFSFLVANTNTGAVTINVDGIGSKAITRTGTTALVAGDMVAGQAVEIIYDGTRFQLVNGNSFTNLKVSGTLGVTGVATFTAQPIVSSLTASLPVFTDASKGLVSNTMTGTGNVVMSTSPTLTTPVINGFTGDTSVINIGSGQIYKDASGNVGIGTTSAYSATTDVLTVTRNQNNITQLLIDNQNAGSSSQTRLALEASGGGWYIANQKTNNPLVISNATGERMRIDSSGNLLVGTTTANYGSSGRGDLEVNGSASSLIALKFGGDATNSSYLYNDATNLEISATGSRFLRFTTNSSEAMRIDSSGNLLVGTTSAGVSERLNVTQPNNATGIYVNPTNASYTGTGVYVNTTRAAATAFDLYAGYANTVQQFGVNGSGFIYSAQLTGGATTLSTNASAQIIRTPSDASLKTNVQPITYGLDTVMKLKPIKHEWVESINMGAPSIGFIAQDMELEVPEVVSGEEYKSIDYPKLTAVLTKAIQELKAIVDAQAVRIAALEL